MFTMANDLQDARAPDGNGRFGGALGRLRQAGDRVLALQQELAAVTADLGRAGIEAAVEGTDPIVIGREYTRLVVTAPPPGRAYQDDGRRSHDDDDQDAPLAPTEPAGSGPKYLRLVRKEARLRADQLDALAEVRRHLVQARDPGTEEPLTDNTLIRVAVDLLLAHTDQLYGSSEEEIRASVFQAHGAAMTS